MVVALTISICFNAFQFLFGVLVLYTLSSKIKELDEVNKRFNNYKKTVGGGDNE